MARSRWTLEEFAKVVEVPILLNGEEPLEPEWGIEKLLLRGGFNILGGAHKSGKSLLRSHLLISAITGRPALNQYQIARPASRVLLLAGEEIADFEKGRLNKAARGLGLAEGSDLANRIHILPQCGFFFNSAEDFEMFRQWVAHQDYDLVVIDPLIRWHTADENVSAQLSPILTRLRSLCDLTTILLIHHVRQPSGDWPEDAPIGYLLRGSSDLAAIYDHFLLLKDTPGRGRAKKMLHIDTRYDENPPPLEIELKFDDDAYTFEIRQSVEKKVLGVFRRADEEWLSKNRVFDMLGGKRAEVLTAVDALTLRGFLEKSRLGWRLSDDPPIELL